MSLAGRTFNLASSAERVPGDTSLKRLKLGASFGGGEDSPARSLMIAARANSKRLSSMLQTLQCTLGVIHACCFKISHTFSLTVQSYLLHLHKLVKCAASQALRCLKLHHCHPYQQQMLVSTLQTMQQMLYCPCHFCQPTLVMCAGDHAVQLVSCSLPQLLSASSASMLYLNHLFQITCTMPSE